MPSSTTWTCTTVTICSCFRSIIRAPEFVYQPKYAAYLNLIEPWWKVLRSLALKGRRFHIWVEVVAAIGEATAYWQTHKHPFIWGQRRRHHPLFSKRTVIFTTKVLRI